MSRDRFVGIVTLVGIMTAWPTWSVAAPDRVAVASCFSDRVALFQAEVIREWTHRERQAALANFPVNDSVEKTAAAASGSARSVQAIDCPAYGEAAQVSDFALKFPKRDDIDAYVVITPDTMRSGFDETPYRLSGVGLFRGRNFFRGDYLTATYCAFRVSVIEAKSGRIVGTQHVETHRKVASSLWPGDYADLSKEQELQLGRELAALVERSVTEALTKLKLTLTSN